MRRLASAAEGRHSLTEFAAPSKLASTNQEQASQHHFTPKHNKDKNKQRKLNIDPASQQTGSWYVFFFVCDNNTVRDVTTVCDT